MKSRLWIPLLIVAVLGTAETASGFSYLDRFYGTAQLGTSIRSRGIGGTGAALGNGAYSLVDNPAALLIVRGSRLQGVVGASRVSEDRNLPLYDTFGSFVDDATIAVNVNDYADITGGFVVDAWGEKGIILAAGLFDRLDPRYDFFNEQRDPDPVSYPGADKIIATQSLFVTGVIRALTAGIAIPLNEASGFGAAVNYYFGKVDTRAAEVDYENPSNSGSLGLDRDLTGWSVTFGATAKLSERVQIGLALESAPRLHDDYTAFVDGVAAPTQTSNTDLDLPLRFQGGLAFHPRNTLRTTFALDVVYQPWSEVEDGLRPDETLNDAWQVRFGLEQIFYNNLPARIGFRYEESYSITEADRSIFTFGVGYLFDRWNLDLAGEVGKWTSRQDNIVELQDPSQVRVEDTVVRVFIGLDYAF